MKYLEMPRLTEDQSASFMSRLQPIGGCVVWVGGRCSGGYGVVDFNGTKYQAHRIAYFLSTGNDPGPLDTCHTCDNPPCCEPAHLFLGTVVDNMRDCARKSRTRYNTHNPGSKNHNAKLTEEQARIIKFSPKTCRELAIEFGISITVVSLIRRGKRWQHVT